jgi:DNA-binding IclR family transcriptional regulator
VLGIGRIVRDRGAAFNRVSIYEIASRMMRQRSSARQDGSRTNVGVLDRAVSVLDAVESGARSLSDVVAATGLSRATAYRLIRALEDHGLLTRLGGQGFRLGPRLLRLATVAMRELPIRDLARPALVRLARTTGESAQLYVRSGEERVCIDAVESTSELRTIVQIGAALPLTAGSAGKVFLAWGSDDELDRALARYRRLTKDAPDAEGFRRDVSTARRRGWAESAGEREPGVASVSAPVLGPHAAPLAVVSISAPSSRIARFRARAFAPAVVEAAAEIRRALGYGPG